MKFIHKIIQIPLIIVLFITLSFSGAEAQQRTGLILSGEVLAVSDNGPVPLPGANVILFTVADSLLVRGTTTGEDGSFTLARVQPGSYDLVVTFIGYETVSRRIDVGQENISGIGFLMAEVGTDLDEVSVTGLAPRMEIRGDTTAFNADAYRVNRDASAEDLVRRMPGFTVENGRVQAQGEELGRVLVDGEEFFGDDATLALRNLPAEIIQQIEVFDQLSDQALFTGFNDGNTTRTLNVVTRAGMNNGRFGRLNGSYGTSDRYMGSGNVNMFNGSRRISVLGMSNNMNQLNFSGEDLLGVAQGEAGSGRGGGMIRGGGPGGGRRGGAGRGGNNARDFLIGQQRGINTVHSGGINYIDRWGDSWRVSSSYFFNATDNTNNQSLERRYLTGFDVDEIYDENSVSDSDNYNHRLNGRLEYTIDPKNSLIITPRLSFQQNKSAQVLQGFTMAGTDMLNQSSNMYDSDNSGYNAAGNILFRHRFEKSGRTFSANLRGDFNSRDGDQFQTGESIFYNETNLNLATNQHTGIITRGQSISTSFQYTEPVTGRSQITAGYTPGIDLSLSERDAWLFDEAAGTYSIPDAQLTSRFDNRVYTHNWSGGYRYAADNYNFNTTLGWQYTLLRGEQTFPAEVYTRKTYQNLMPSAMMMYRFSRSSNLMVRYNTLTRTPSATQLQDVVDNSNPLQLRGGNPDLSQQYIHNLSTRYRSSDAERGTSFMSFVNVGYTLDYIGNLTYTAVRDTVIRDGIVLGRGSRFITPENTGNAWNIRSFFNYGMPAGFIRSNVNLFSGISYSLTPTAVNSSISNTRNLGLNGGLSVTSNISPEVDFTLSYGAGYNFVDNPDNLVTDNNYYTGRAGARVNLQIFGRLVLASEMSVSHYSGLDLDFNPDTYYWNGSLGYKFLPDNAGELRFTIIDILGQNNSVNRSIGENYVEDIRSDVLSTYMMMTFSYNFRAFGGR